MEHPFIQYTDTTMPNIDTVSFIFKDISLLKDTACLLNKTDSVIYEASTPIQHNLPHSPLTVNNHLTGELIYTIIFVIAFAFIRLRGKNLFHNFFNILVKRKKTDTLLSDGVSSNLVCYILSLFLSLSIISGCISFVIGESFLTIYTLYAFIALFLYHFTLLLIINLFGWTFNSKNIASELSVNLWTFQIISGLVVSPFVLSSFFVQNFAIIPLLKITTLGLALLLVVRIIRWIEILFIHRVSILYMILYLCAFEIIPLLILYKIVM